MMQWTRRRAWTSLPVAAVVALALLAPNLWATTKHKVVKHSVAKRHLPPHPSHRAKSVATSHRLTRKVPNHRAPKAHRARRRKTRLPLGPSADRIDQIQQALARSGYYQGDPTGRWDSDTIESMREFQQSHGITPSGKIDAPSLQQLGLGSDVAGVAAPRPVVPSDLAASGKGNKGADRDR